MEVKRKVKEWIAIYDPTITTHVLLFYRRRNVKQDQPYGTGYGDDKSLEVRPENTYLLVCRESYITSLLPSAFAA